MALGEHFYNNGFFSGWTQYRKGGGRKPTLAPVSILAKKSKPILPKGRRQRVVSDILDGLRDWRTSPFEHEAAMLAGMRSAFCLQGHRWGLADMEASGIVAEALRLAGAQRPSWEEGQPEYTVPRENCSWCGCAMPEEMMQSNRTVNFCSDVCARAALSRRDRASSIRAGYMFKSAYQAIARAKNDAKDCRECGNRFRPGMAHHEFCSKTCAGKYRRTVPERNCPQCDKRFRPHWGGTIYCSAACHGRAKRTIETRICAECKGEFRPHQNGRVADACCSRECAMRKRKRLGAIYSFDCQCCGQAFESRSARSLYCSPQCIRLVNRFATGHGVPKRMTALLFDYWFTAGVPIAIPPLTAPVFDEWFRRAA